MSGLFSTSTPKLETPPTPQSGDTENAAMMERLKQSRRKGFFSTQKAELSGAAPTAKKTLFGA